MEHSGRFYGPGKGVAWTERQAIRHGVVGVRAGWTAVGRPGAPGAGGQCGTSTGWRRNAGFATPPPDRPKIDEKRKRGSCTAKQVLT